MPPTTIFSSLILLVVGTIWLRSGVLGLARRRPLVLREIWGTATGLTVTLAIFVSAIPATPIWILCVVGAAVLPATAFMLHQGGLLVMGVRVAELRAHLDTVLATLPDLGSPGSKSMAVPVRPVPRLDSTMPGASRIRVRLAGPAMARLARTLAAQLEAAPLIFERGPFVLAIVSGLLLMTLGLLLVLQRALWG